MRDWTFKAGKMQFGRFIKQGTLLGLSISSLSAVAFAQEKPPVAVAEAVPAAAVACAADGTALCLTAGGGKVKLYLGSAPDHTPDISLDKGTTLVGHGGLLQTNRAETSAVMLVTPKNELRLAWGSGGHAYLAGCALADMKGAAGALRKEAYAAPDDLGPGVPTDIAFDARAGKSVVVGWAAEEAGCVWVASAAGRAWPRVTIATGQGNVRPQIAVAKSGVAHVVWRKKGGIVWHLERAGNGTWMRSGGTSTRAERIGHSVSDPAIAACRHQVLVVMDTEKKQLVYSLYTGQNWNTNQPLTSLDKRWKKDTLSQPQLTVDGHGVPWLFFVNTTGHRKFSYYSRWLGFGWDTICEGRGIFHAADDFLDNLAAIEGCALPAFVPEGADGFSLLLVNNKVARPLRIHRIQTPVTLACPGAEILFLDMLDVGEALWTEQKLGTVRKHPDNPVMRPSGDPQTLDSHRVFNGGTVLHDKDGFKAWYSASNPEGDWAKWWELLHFCYATSKDGITWEKPNLGQVEFKGNKDNNALPGVNIFMPVIPNPDSDDSAHRFVGYDPGKGLRWSSADGVHWQKQAITCKLLGKQPKWFVYNSILHDPEAHPSRRWRAYGCMCPNEPPVRRTIAYAYSADGTNFFGPPENPIFQAETGGSWAKVHDVSVTRYKGHYVMIYQTGNGYDQHLELAVSRDGEHFTRIHDGQAFIPQGKGDAWDRGLHLPSRPLVLDNEIRLYYGAADYQAPEDPFDYERWKKCRMGMGLATLPLDGWTYLRNRLNRHVGYITTVPIAVEDLKGCVLTVNAEADADHYLLAELLQGDSEDRIPGYEHENCDKMEKTGVEQPFSWKGKSGLDGVKAKRIRVRVIFRGKGDAPKLRAIGFRRKPGVVAPSAFVPAPKRVERSLVYVSSVSHVSPQKAWIAYRPDGKPKPLL